jgi:hypothetical protein
MFQLGLPELIVISVTVIASVLGAVIPFWQISKKGWLSSDAWDSQCNSTRQRRLFLLSRFRRLACDRFKSQAWQYRAAT